MSTRPYPPSMPLLIGYDPEVDIPLDHLSRLVEQVVEALVPGGSHEPERGRPAFDLRLCIKVLVFGYSTGVRSSRQLERLCREHLAYLYLTRGDAPCYRTLCSVRVSHKSVLEEVWQGLFAVAGAHGISRLGRIVVDSSKFRADASRECVLTPGEYQSVLAELRRIVAEAEQTDQAEEAEGGGSGTRLGQEVGSDQMRDILRRVRSDLARRKKEKAASTSAEEADAAPTIDGEEAKTALPISIDTDEAVTPAEANDLKLGSTEDNTTVNESADVTVPRLTDRMLARIEAGIDAIEAALLDKRTHLCLTDPDARMMPEGTEAKIRECHSFEIAVDNGLIVAGQTTQIGSDQLRLGAIVEAAAENEPDGITAVDGDSGFYSGDSVAGLIISGTDTCIPEGHTACDLRRNEPIGTTRLRVFGTVPFTYVESENHYTCPNGNVLRFHQIRKKGGQTVSIYKAQSECIGCPLASQCLTNAGAKRRQLNIGAHQEVLEKARKRFEEPEHQERYHQRGPAVETVFAFIRAVLGFRRWSLRGSEKVACEGSLFKIAYQIRKILPAWQTGKVSALAEG